MNGEVLGTVSNTKLSDNKDKAHLHTLLPANRTRNVHTVASCQLSLEVQTSSDHSYYCDVGHQLPSPPTLLSPLVLLRRIFSFSSTALIILYVLPNFKFWNICSVRARVFIYCCILVNFVSLLVKG